MVLDVNGPRLLVRRPRLPGEPGRAGSGGERAEQDEVTGERARPARPADRRSGRTSRRSPGWRPPVIRAVPAADRGIGDLPGQGAAVDHEPARPRPDHPGRARASARRATIYVRVATAEINRLSFVRAMHPTRVELSKLGPSAAALGAASLVLHSQLTPHQNSNPGPDELAGQEVLQPEAALLHDALLGGVVDVHDSEAAAVSPRPIRSCPSTTRRSSPSAGGLRTRGPGTPRCAARSSPAARRPRPSRRRSARPGTPLRSPSRTTATSGASLLIVTRMSRSPLAWIGQPIWVRRQTGVDGDDILAARLRARLTGR